MPIYGSREKFRLKNELNNKWTGLRKPPKTQPIGYNWTTYYCIIRINPNFDENIMVVINQFLNWFPAGCWKTSDDEFCCSICGMGFYIYGTIYGFKVCSMQCKEIYLRNIIISDYTLFVKEVTKEFLIPNIRNAYYNCIECKPYCYDECICAIYIKNLLILYDNVKNKYPEYCYDFYKFCDITSYITQNNNQYNIVIPKQQYNKNYYLSINKFKKWWINNNYDLMQYYRISKIK